MKFPDKRRAIKLNKRCPVFIRMFLVDRTVRLAMFKLIMHGPLQGADQQQQEKNLFFYEGHHVVQSASFHKEP